MYNKLFTKILDSTIWLEPDATRLVWITMLAAMDEDGFVALSSVGNVAARARVAEDAAETAIKALESPDRHGKDQEHDGRRIERVPYGWMVLNAEKYRDMVRRDNAREATRERVARHRARNADVTAGNASVTTSVSDAVSEAKAGKSKTLAPDAARPAPKQNGKIEFDHLKGAFKGITEADELRWQEAYPAVPIPPEIAKAAAWLHANPANRKKNNERFLVNWFARSQDRAGRVRR